MKTEGGERIPMDENKESEESEKSEKTEISESLQDYLNGIARDLAPLIAEELGEA